MKKIILLVAVLLMVSSVAFAQQGKWTAADLSQVKGTWTGMLEFPEVGSSCACDVEILNSNVPVQGKLVLYGLNERLASMIGLTAGTNLFDNPNGQLTTKGTLMWAANNSFIEIWPAGGGSIAGWFYFRGAKGDLKLKRK